MSSRLNKVQASMYSVVDELLPVDSVFLLEVSVKARLYVFEDGLPAVIVVDKVTKAWCVDDGEPQLDAVFLNVCRDGLDSNCLWSFGRGRSILLWRIEGRVEERVYQS